MSPFTIITQRHAFTFNAPEPLIWEAIEPALLSAHFGGNAIGDVLYRKLYILAFCGEV